MRLSCGLETKRVDTMETIKNTASSPNAAHASNAPELTSTEELYKFSAYDAQLPISIGEGMRVVKCLYKTNTKTGKAAGANSYILVPEKHLAEQVMIDNAAMLAPYMAAFLQDVEDKIIKDYHVKGGIGFNDSFLSLSKILESLDNAGQGNRLNKEKIEDWFNSDMKEPLLVAFADKMGVSDQPTQAELDKLENVTAVYLAKFASLASGKTMYRKEEAELLQKALVVTGVNEENAIGVKFWNRLESMKNTTQNDLLMSL